MAAVAEEMATHSNILAWRIPGTEVPSGLPTMESHRVGHVWSDLAAAAAVADGLMGAHCLVFAETAGNILSSHILQKDEDTEPVLPL